MRSAQQNRTQEYGGEQQPNFCRTQNCFERGGHSAPNIAAHWRRASEPNMQTGSDSRRPVKPPGSMSYFFVRLLLANATNSGSIQMVSDSYLSGDGLRSATTSSRCP